MKKCQSLLSHISRLEGQLRTLRQKIETEESCENIVPLALSTLKSFDSLRSKMVENFVENQLMNGLEVSVKKWDAFKNILKLIKA